MDFSYSKDKNDIYCGTLPMKLPREEYLNFEVTEEDQLMSGMISTISKSHFLELNPSYAWIEKLVIYIENVIIGECGTAKSPHKKYRGFKEIK